RLIPALVLAPVRGRNRQKNGRALGSQFQEKDEEGLAFLGCITSRVLGVAGRSCVLRPWPCPSYLRPASFVCWSLCRQCLSRRLWSCRRCLSHALSLTQ